MATQIVKMKRPAFSLHEKAILLEEMSEKHDILIGKFHGDKNSKILKSKAWDTVTEK